MADTVLKLVRGNDSDMSVCIQRREGSGEPVPYDLSGAEDVRLSLTGHGIHVFAKNVSVTGASSNIITGRMTGRMLLGVYDLEVTFTLGGMAKRFSIPDLAEVVDHLEDDSDGVAEGEGDGIVVTLIIQPEIIEVAGITRDELNAGLALKVDKVTGKGLSTNDYSDTEKAKLGALPTADALAASLAQKVDKIEGKGLSTNDYTDGEKAKLAALPTAETLAGDLDDKVDKVPGKGLSESDFTAGEKTKLAGIAAGAQVNVLETVKVGGTSLEVVSKAVNIPVDSAPTAGSGNLATSGGIQAAIKAVRDALALIEAVVPTQASENNQLADKEYVNTQISTSTAEFRGTVNSVADLPTTGVDDNDYAFVVTTDSAGNTVYNRYKYTPSNGWMFEYALNNSSFTSEQWAAIQSGMTAALVTKLKALPTAAALETSLGQKVDKVTGKGLSTEDYTSAEKTKLGALPSAADLSTSLAGKVDKVTGKGLSTEDYTSTEKAKLAGIEEGAQVNLPVDETPTEGSDNPVSSGGMHAILTPVEEAGAEFLERVAPVNGKTSLGVTRVKGKTLAWNQQTQDRSGTVTYIQGDISTEYVEAIIANFVYGHKYFVHAKVEISEGAVINIGFSGGGQYLLGSFVTNLSQSQIVKAIASYADTQQEVTKVNFRLDSPSAGDSLAVSDCFITDLTLMFGAGNEPETVAEFEAMFPLPYYDYNPGELVNVAATGVKTVGFNQWDEEWETGYYSIYEGVPIASPDYVRSKNDTPIRIFPSTEYCLTIKNQHNIRDHIGNVLFYDIERNFISTQAFYVPGLSKTFTTPDRAYYMRFYLTDYYGNQYANDICINLSDPDRNGEYEPYKEDVVPLGLDSFKVKDSSGNILEINGLASAGNEYDEKNSEKTIQRIGRVDLNTLNWIPGGTNVYYSDVVPDMKSYSNCVCSKYASGAPGNTSEAINGADKTIRCGSDSRFYLKDSGSLSMAGVMLYYELATPVEYDLAEPRAWVAEREDGGTETVLPLDSDPPIVPPILDLRYGDYAEEIAPFLKSDLASAESVKAMLEALKTAGVISAYTMIWNKSARRYDFTITQ